MWWGCTGYNWAGTGNSKLIPIHECRRLQGATAIVGQAEDAGRAGGAVLGSWRDSQQHFFFCRINRSNVIPWNLQSEVSSAVPCSMVEGELLLHLHFPNHCLPWHHQSRELPSTWGSLLLLVLIIMIITVSFQAVNQKYYASYFSSLGNA